MLNARSRKQSGTTTFEESKSEDIWTHLPKSRATSSFWSPRPHSMTTIGIPVRLLKPSCICLLSSYRILQSPQSQIQSQNHQLCLDILGNNFNAPQLLRHPKRQTINFKIGATSGLLQHLLLTTHQISIILAYRVSAGSILYGITT